MKRLTVVLSASLLAVATTASAQELQFPEIRPHERREAGRGDQLSARVRPNQDQHDDGGRGDARSLLLVGPGRKHAVVRRADGTRHGSQFGMCAVLKGVPNPNQGINSEDYKSKAQAVKALAASFAFCDSAFSSLTEKSLLEYVKERDGEITRAGSHRPLLRPWQRRLRIRGGLHAAEGTGPADDRTWDGGPFRARGRQAGRSQELGRRAGSEEPALSVQFVATPQPGCRASASCQRPAPACGRSRPTESDNRDSCSRTAASPASNASRKYFRRSCSISNRPQWVALDAEEGTVDDASDLRAALTERANPQLVPQLEAQCALNLFR